ncbi:O-antigen ligase family protein [Sphingomonas lacunae]|uniref:O-antigen ligase family protein n=1 Tax=Sphingomonas lacunae TaxID=2698828 RepID=A0A6M4AUK3_9SPHN|nr:O-antigen ligase family protein [Sphingomonas lacunae]QJQ32785.1 O-antigen ligase family protein [Sphingomonas lacunae]
MLKPVRPNKKQSLPSLHFASLILLVAATFLMGGASRADVLSLAILRPIAAILLVIGLYGLTWQMTRGFRLVCGLAAALTLLIALQLVPLPPALWTNLPGRDLLADGLVAAGLPLGWQPISMVPSLTWNALFSLLVPLAGLVLMLRCTAEERLRMLPVLIIAGVCSAVLGFFQASAPGTIEFYALTNEGFPVGLFANRNHQAIWLCCLPILLAGWSSHAEQGERARGAMLQVCALLLVIALIPLVLITGSRAGVLLYALSLALAAAIRFGPGIGAGKVKWGRQSMALLGGFLFIALIVTIASMSRDVAVGRLMAGAFTDDLRAAILPRSLDLAWAYFPFGAGFGTFPEIFKIGETQTTLGSSYVNHAHSDWIEFLIDGGIAALVILMIGLIAWANVLVQLIANRRPHNHWLTMGLVAGAVIFVLGLASIADYPVRVPSLMLVGVVAIVWLAQSKTEMIAKRD